MPGMIASVLWMMLTADAEERWFYPNVGPDVAVVRDGRLGGVPARFTGAVVARVDDPDAMRALPEVTQLRVLAGDGHVVRMVLAPGTDEAAWSVDLRDRLDVTWAHPDLQMQLTRHDLPNDPGAVDQWHLRNDGQRGNGRVDIHVEKAWELTRGAGTVVAVIDSGVDMTHPDLPMIGGFDPVDGDDDPTYETRDDGHPHGTATAGVIAARGDNGIGVAGVAWEADLTAVRLLTDGATDLSHSYEAFVRSVDEGADVLNNSWGFSADGCPDIPIPGILWDGLDYAEENGRGGLGTVVVISAGNGGCDMSNDLFQSHPSLINVGAINARDRREGYSNFGDHLDIVAPSGNILTTDITGDDGYGAYDGDPDYYANYSGTSASAPVVSGVAALMVSVNDRITAAQVREILCATSVRIDHENTTWDEDGWSPEYGCGRVDASAAVFAAKNAAPDAPVPYVRELLPTTDPVLYWSPVTDPDDDPITYEVRVWRAEGRARAKTLQTRMPWADITEIAPVGEPLLWRVTPIDRFGPGEPSPDMPLLLVEATLSEAPAGGCDTGRVGWLAALAVPFLVRRRKQR
jgi:subtilisin family serine protease